MTDHSEAPLSFDEMADTFTARVRKASDWRQNYFGAAHSSRIKRAIVELREAIEQAEAHPEIGNTRALTPAPAGSEKGE